MVNLDTLEDFDGGNVVDPGVLRSHGLVASAGLVKILGRGELTRPLTVRANAFSQSGDPGHRGCRRTASRSSRAPWGDGRPPAGANALTNR